MQFVVSLKSVLAQRADPGGRWGGYNHPMIDTFAMDFQPQLDVNTLKPSLVFLLILLAKS